MASKRSLEVIEIKNVPELEGLRLTPQEVQFIMAYVGPTCRYSAKRAFRSVISDEEFKEMNKRTFYARAGAILQQKDVKQAIVNFLAKDVEEKRELIMPTLINDLLEASSYDPAEIIDDDGDWVRGSLRSVSIEKRKAVVEGVDLTFFGKECQERVRTVKLTSKSKARQQLIDLLKLRSQLQDEDKAKNATLNVTVTTNDISGMATAFDLMKQSAEGAITAVEEEEEK